MAASRGKRRGWSLIGGRHPAPKGSGTYRRVRDRCGVRERLETKRFGEEGALMERGYEMGRDRHRNIHTQKEKKWTENKTDRNTNRAKYTYKRQPSQY